MYQLRNLTTLSACALATASLLTACGGGSADTPALTAQATLTASADSTTLATSATTSLRSSGGSGTGAVTYAVASGTCTISGTTLTATSSPGTCTVTATKAADSTYLAATSAAITVTVTPAVASTTFVSFDEGSAPTMTAFGAAMVATVDTDPTGGSNKAGKLVKSAGADTWAGATISKCSYPTNSLAVIPLSSSNKTMTLRAYSPTAPAVFRLKLEDGTDNTHSVETEATVTTANTWQTLTFDFGAQATGTAAWNSTYTYNKASIFPEFGTAGTSTKTYYVDDLKFIGVSGVSQTCMTPPVTGIPSAAAPTPTKATANVSSIYSDVAGYGSPAGIDFPFWGDSTVTSTYTIGSDNMVKMMTLNYKGITWTTPLNLSTFTKLHVDFWSADATSIDVFIISGSTGPTTEQSVNVPLTANAWTSTDIPMSSYTTPNKSDIFQIKLVGNPSGKTVYMDNFYFWK
ncbi:MAG: hypothetical protein ACKOWD_10920 [Rhodoferax sp.]